MAIPTPEEMRRMREQGVVPIVGCARADGPLLRHDYLRGVRCAVCHTELQVSPRGFRQIEAGSIPMCNECALCLAEEEKARGRSAEFVLSPEAEAAMQRGHTRMDPRRLEKLTGRKFAPWNYSEPDRCQFCSQNELDCDWGLHSGPGLWLYPHRSFEFSAVNMEDDSLIEKVTIEGDWYGCDPCARLFEKRRINALVEKTLLLLLKDVPTEIQREALRALYGGLAMNLKGPRRWQDLRRRARA